MIWYSKYVPMVAAFVGDYMAVLILVGILILAVSMALTTEMPEWNEWLFWQYNGLCVVVGCMTPVLILLGAVLLPLLVPLSLCAIVVTLVFKSIEKIKERKCST